MKRILFFGFFAFYLFSTECREESFTLVADISAYGIIGSVAFTQMHEYYPISIRVELQPNSYSAHFGWEIHEMPVLWGYSDEDYCSKSVYQSRMLHNLTERHGKLESRALYNDEFITVMSFTDSIVGSSLVIIDPETGPVSCSTILPLLSAPTTIFKAEFKSKLGGYVYFLPYFDISFKQTLIIGSLYKTDGISVPKEYDWYIGKTIRTPYASGCGDKIRAIFDLLKPQNESCIDSEKKCAIGDLSLKHSKITVGVALDWSTSRPFVFKDPNLPLDGWNSIAWRTLYLVDPFTKETFACAVIKPVDEIKYRVELRKSLDFKSNETLGVVYFKQTTPYHSTYVKIRIQEDKNMKLDKANPPTFVIYSLFPIGVDCNAIGNILMDKKRRPMILISPKVFEDYNNDSIHAGIIEIGLITGFTLTGPKSILMKSVAVFEKFPEDTTAQYCGQILPAKFEEAVALVANFSFSKIISGYVLMVQYLFDKNMQFSDTAIIMDLKNKNGYITIGHKLHIHNYLIPRESQLSGDNSICESTDGHFNPFGVNTAMPMYGSECKPDFMARCEVGDLDSKHGLCDIGRSRRLNIDSNLNLFGVDYNLQKSLVVHGEKKQKTMIACARIEKFSYDNED